MIRFLRPVVFMFIVPVSCNMLASLPSEETLINLIVDDAVNEIIGTDLRFIAGGGDATTLPSSWSCSGLDLFYTYSTVVAATNNNTANTIVQRGPTGSFNATSITSDLIGNVTGNITGTAGAAVYAHRATSFTGTAGAAVYAHQATLATTTTTFTGTAGAAIYAHQATLATTATNCTGTAGAAIYAHQATLATNVTNFTGTAGASVYAHRATSFTGTAGAAVYAHQATLATTATTFTGTAGAAVYAHQAILATTATNCTGTAGAAVYAHRATTATSFTGALSGDISGTQDCTAIDTVGGKTAREIASTVNTVAAASSSIAAGCLVKQNSNGDISTREATLSLGLNLTSTGAIVTLNSIPFIHGLGDTSNTNAFIGSSAGSLTLTSSRNTGLGAATLSNNRLGSGNIAVGYSAGNSLVNGNNNIYVGNQGITRESSVIRLGTTGTHTGCSIAGISGANVSKWASAVFVDTSGRLGTIVSSQRFKKDITNLPDKSHEVESLRPVSFRYNDQEMNDQVQYGLIAEEVEKILPEMVIYNDDGQVQSVAYHLLPILLLQQYQKQQETLRTYANQIKQLQDEIFTLKQTA